jgi:hypothetical protein
VSAFDHFIGPMFSDFGLDWGALLLCGYWPCLQSDRPMDFGVPTCWVVDLCSLHCPVHFVSWLGLLSHT